ncbi:HipA domain-containing protein [Microbacterium sp. LRZ72]|uniref:type II toxin-antitoxin system HipA family toxin n=1 Tax=Microbacterium sp. LRZ72 TaxID=2942481 RepID=UPI0029B7254C|nr:HipA domain-containing protein [Microbacterium sp. LRZ72]MDX2377881.1 HipA domain-containing protein [Microbacterium sp. LRZ72]
MKIAVELYGEVIGHLSGDARTFDIDISGEAMTHFGLNSRVLSVALPLSPRLPRHHAGRRRNWFAELLPEGDQLDHMLARRALRRGDVPAFLAAYGRDVAGALQIWDVDDPTEPPTARTTPVDAREIRVLLEDPLGAPLGNETAGGKSSLGGVQPKIVLARIEDGWARAVGGFPSTHILKPQLASLPTVIFDEEYGARLARGLGLASFDTTVRSFDGLPTLVIERFDRASGTRIHQEDFNQALGAGGNQKYQEIGGVVSLARVADVLTRHAHSEELRTLARMLVLTVAVGNLDLHTKNLALLHPRDGDLALAPAYDVVPMAHRSDVDGRLALAVNGEYAHTRVTSADLVAETSAWGLRRAQRVVDATLEEIDALVGRETPLEGAATNLHDRIRRSVRNLIEGRAAGADA